MSFILLCLTCVSHMLNIVRLTVAVAQSYAEGHDLTDLTDLNRENR